MYVVLLCSWERPLYTYIYNKTDNCVTHFKNTFMYVVPWLHFPCRASGRFVLGLNPIWVTFGKVDS